jgi:tetratricopeptide (TPR) repeat protein
LAALQFQEAVRRAPRETQGDAYQSLIDVLRKARKPEQIARVCRDGLQNSPEIAPVFFNYFLAGALAELGEAEGALAAADKAIEQTGESDRLTVRLQKIYVLRVLGKWEEAIELGKKLLDDFDSLADRHRVRYALAGAYWGAKKSDEAEAELRAILDTDPDHAAACNDLGFHLADQGRNLDEAERLIRRAIAGDKLDRKKSGYPSTENATYRDSLGWVLFRKGKLAEARVEIEKAAALYDGASDPIIWDHLGDVLFRLGEKAKAKEAWEKAEKLYESEARGSSRGRYAGRLEELKRKMKRLP